MKRCLGAYPGTYGPSSHGSQARLGGGSLNRWNIFMDVSISSLVKGRGGFFVFGFG